MGCAPSKGKLFSKPEGAPAVEAGGFHHDHCKPSEEQKKCLQCDEKEKEPPLPTEELPQEITAAQIPGDIQITENNALPQEMKVDLLHTDQLKKIEKRKKNKGKKRLAEKKRKSWIVHTKVDFPPHMVRAHQAAYTFLNPNICKYETLLGLLDQAAQTHLSLQPRMSALLLHFEEINQALEEMAEEGELMLKGQGNFMALPSGMMASAGRPAKSSIDPVHTPDPPPDLLQQMLQQSTEKMRHVGGSVQALGDATLEEAVKCFSSLSKLLVEKLQAKQAAEQRLTLVLAHVEYVAMRKSNPEDSALHSEDSGIGGENESLTGSERHRRHRGSAGSGSSGSGGNFRGVTDNPFPHLPNLVNHNEEEEEEEEEEEDEDEDEDEEEEDDEDGDGDEDDDYEDDESERVGRQRSNSSPPDPSQALCFMQANYLKDQHVKRPLTSFTKPGQSSPTRCVNLLLELQNNQSNWDQRIKNMSRIPGNKELAGRQYNSAKTGLRRHSLNVPTAAYRGQLRRAQPPGHLPMLLPQPPNCTSVRRLINTFSQGVDGRPGQSLANIPPHIRKSRKERGILFSDSNDRGFIINGNNNNNSWSDSRDDLDVDSLPPPPPEVLMDNSFQRTEGLTGPEDALQQNVAQSLPMIKQKSGVSHRLKASVQNVDLLPKRVSMKPRSSAVSSAHPVRQDAVMAAQESDQQSLPDLDPDIEKANCLYQQARKIIHLRNSVESSGKKNIVIPSGEFYDSETALCILPVTAPPVSRVRLPPSCPSVRHRFPSPPVCRPPSTSVVFSRPSSPQTVTRVTDKVQEEIIPSVSFRDARSVFCQNDSQTLLAPGSSVLPRRRRDGSRGRLATREADSSNRRTQSEQRPGVTSQLSRQGGSASAQGGSGNHRPDSAVMSAEEDQ